MQVRTESGETIEMASPEEESFMVNPPTKSKIVIAHKALVCMAKRTFLHLSWDGNSEVVESRLPEYPDREALRIFKHHFRFPRPIYIDVYCLEYLTVDSDSLLWTVGSNLLAWPDSRDEIVALVARLQQGEQYESARLASQVVFGMRENEIFSHF